MSYKKWIYKYKYLQAEVEEMEEEMEKYSKEFNKIFILKNESPNPVLEPEPISEDLSTNQKRPKPTKSLYKDLSKKLHPDKGGDGEEFIELNEMYESDDVLGMYVKADELGIDIKDNYIENEEEYFLKSCESLELKKEKITSTAAWLWGITPIEQRPSVIQMLEVKFGIILKQNL
jgi:hypothetical protein